MSEKPSPRKSEDMESTSTNGHAEASTSSTDANEVSQPGSSKDCSAGPIEVTDCPPGEGEDDCDDGEVVTMEDVLKDSAILEEHAKAVLGNADSDNCTYFSGGYMKRQALYACLTCTKSDSKFISAGVCLACSYHCHEGHDLVELYTKRAFRCDCGNSKFGDVKCKLAETKTALNDENKYNQNFTGLYCSCHRPYPDPEDETPDEMIQCVVCEDWFHGRHLGPNVPKDDKAYAEMICLDCVQKHDFLKAYVGYSVSVVKADNSLADVSVADMSAEDASSIEGAANDSINTSNKENGENASETPGECKLKTFAAPSQEESEPSSLFMAMGWRQQLCRCSNCLEIYNIEEVSFLLDPEDTVHFYESQSNGKDSQYDLGMEALGNLDRTQQVEAIQSYNSMKTHLMEYLKKFASNGKVVRPEDIQEFFEDLKSNKRRKVEIPKFCR